MKRKIISGIKIYIISIIYILLITFIYSAFLMKTNKDSNVIIEIVIGCTAFILLGVLYGNMIHKKGLIVGLIVGFTHVLLINFILFLANGQFNLKPLLLTIYTLSSALGGVLGLTFKKII